MQQLKHIRKTVTGWAIANGCQGIFVEEIFFHREDASERLIEMRGGDPSPDWQVVAVNISLEDTV